MELSKDDIQYVAYRRFNRKHLKKLVGFDIGMLALLVALMLAINPDRLSVILAIGLPIIVLIYVGIWLYNRAADKLATSLIEECEANPTLTYVAEPTKEAEKVIG